MHVWRTCVDHRGERAAACGGLSGLATREAGVSSQSLGHLLEPRPHGDASTRRRASLAANVDRKTEEGCDQVSLCVTRLLLHRISQYYATCYAAWCHKQVFQSFFLGSGFLCLTNGTFRPGSSHKWKGAGVVGIDREAFKWSLFGEDVAFTSSIRILPTQRGSRKMRGALCSNDRHISLTKRRASLTVRSHSYVKIVEKKKTKHSTNFYL